MVLFYGHIYLEIFCFLQQQKQESLSSEVNLFFIKMFRGIYVHTILVQDENCVDVLPQIYDGAIDELITGTSCLDAIEHVLIS